MFIAGLFLLVQAVPQTTAADSLRADSLARWRAQQLERVQVSAIRAGEQQLSAKTLGRAEIQRGYSGQETPILLQAVPGITAYSESGSASNYSYIRVRGIDQTRINITLDGIPLNEPEDEALYFSNFPDFANSISSVQVQRGVGSSSFGTASYAGSVNFESIPVAGVPRGGELQLSGGSYNTRRVSGAYQTGLTTSGFAAYARGSSQETDGYRFNSGNRSRSAFLSGGWFGSRDVFKVSLLAGLSSNDQAYYAVPLSVLQSTPRDNPFGNSRADEVTDRFHQDLFSASWTRALSPSATIGTTVYGFDAGGWYDYPGDHGLSDASHYYLHSRWGGVISSAEWRGDNASFSVGVNASRYSREHWLTVRPDLDSRLYDNTGHKGDQSVFAKSSVIFGQMSLFADLQMRAVQFRYEPTRGSGTPAARTDWAFFNPKVGVTHRVSQQTYLYASAGANGREPTRSDLFAGADDIDSVTAREVFPLTHVRPERVFDVETGAHWSSSRVDAVINGFYMRFRDEIAAIGAISQLGYELRKNVPRSVRRGVEGDARWRPGNSVRISADLSVTDAIISEYTDESTGTTVTNVTPVMTPKVVSNQTLRTDLTSWLSADLSGRYVSRMMLTNTNDDRFVVPAAWYSDAGLIARYAGRSLLVQVRNVFDTRVYTGGYPGSVPGANNNSAMEPYYYILAPRNVSVNLRLPL